jgi:hypothetical protein
MDAPDAQIAALKAEIAALRRELKERACERADLLRFLIGPASKPQRRATRSSSSHQRLE